MSVVFLAMIVPYFVEVFDMITSLAEQINLQDTYILLVLKVIGIAYATEFGCQLCKDLGEDSIASKLQMAGRILIIIIAMPIAKTLIELITNLI